MYAIVNRKLVPPRVCRLKDNLLFNGKRGLEVLMSEALVGNLYRIKTDLTCAEAEDPDCRRANFRFSYIPHDKEFEYAVDTFPKGAMADLHEEGKKWGRDPYCSDGAGEDPAGWCRRIPVTEASEVTCP